MFGKQIGRGYKLDVSQVSSWVASYLFLVTLYHSTSMISVSGTGQAEQVVAEILECREQDLVVSERGGEVLRISSQGFQLVFALPVTGSVCFVSERQSLLHQEGEGRATFCLVVEEV